MIHTKHQENCIAKARKYKKPSMSIKPFRKLYMEYCTDGYIYGNDFIELVKGHTLTTIKPLTKEKPILEYLYLFENKILGKGANKIAQSGATHGNTNKP